MLVDDHQLLTDALEQALAKPGRAITVARTIADAFSIFRKADYDLYLIDINLPDGNGFGLVEHLVAKGRAQSSSAPPIALLTASAASDDINRASKLNVAAYIHKTIPFPKLVAAIDQLLLGPCVGSLGVWDSDQNQFVDFNHKRNGDAELTARELEIFHFIAQGLADKEIAHRAGCSIHTVRAHIRSLKRKREIYRRVHRLSVQ